MRCCPLARSRSRRAATSMTWRSTASSVCSGRTSRSRGSCGRRRNAIGLPPGRSGDARVTICPRTGDSSTASRRSSATSSPAASGSGARTSSWTPSWPTCGSGPRSSRTNGESPPTRYSPNETHGCVPSGDTGTCTQSGGPTLKPLSWRAMSSSSARVLCRRPGCGVPSTSFGSCRSSSQRSSASWTSACSCEAQVAVTTGSAEGRTPRCASRRTTSCSPSSSGSGSAPRYRSSSWRSSRASFRSASSSNSSTCIPRRSPDAQTVLAPGGSSAEAERTRPLERPSWVSSRSST